MSEIILTSSSGKRMIGYIAPIYDNSREMQAVFQANGAEVDELRQWVDEIRLQISPVTATWGLRYYEEFLSIPIDESKPLEQRRSVVLSKWMIKKTPTKKALKDLAAFYENGTITISDPVNNTITITFTDGTGVPPNLDDFKAEAERIIPAHLHVLYAYPYYRINQVHNVMTINQLQSLKLKNFAPFES